VVTRDDPDYPKRLREIYDPPLVLYVRGMLSDRDQAAIGVVGSRRTSLYGQEMSRKLSYQLARLGVAVVSGLARGIDTAAHKGALQAKGRTVAVIGCGIDDLYPPENKQLAEEIVEKGGAVVTEFPFGVKPDRQNFPMRNRIISGWAMGVVVVEADKVLVSVGRRPNTEKLNLSALGIALDEKGYIKTDKRMITNLRGVYAIGDVCGPPLLAHKAFKESLGLTYGLLSDPKGEAARLYDTWNENLALSERLTVVVDKDGIIRYVTRSELLKPRDHREALAALG
jgi:DNA protecting protein DprA